MNHHNENIESSANPNGQPNSADPDSDKVIREDNDQQLLPEEDDDDKVEKDKDDDFDENYGTLEDGHNDLATPESDTGVDNLE